MSCIFCKIAAGEIPCKKVYEDDHFLAFLDISPRNIGHTLVVPKEHYRWVWDHPAGGAYFEVAQKIAKAQKVAFGTDFVVSVILGEEVPHAHIHVIPRFPDDGHGSSIDFSQVKQLSDSEMQDALQKLSSAIALG